MRWKNATLNVISGTPRYSWCKTSIQLIEHLDTADGILLCQRNTSILLIEHLDTTDGKTVSAEHLDTPDRAPRYNEWNDSVSAEHLDTPDRTPGYNGRNNSVSAEHLDHLTEHLDTTDGITLCQRNTSIT